MVVDCPAVCGGEPGLVAPLLGCLLAIMGGQGSGGSGTSARPASEAAWSEGIPLATLLSWPHHPIVGCGVCPASPHPHQPHSGAPDTCSD